MTFGVDVELDGSALAVSTQRIEVDGTGQRIVSDGEVLVLNRSSFGWVQAARVFLHRPTTPDARFGVSVALSADMLVVSGPLAGEAHVYRLAAGSWTWAHRLVVVAASFGGFGSRLRVVNSDPWIAGTAVHNVYRHHFAFDRCRLLQTPTSSGLNPNDGLGRDFWAEGERGVRRAARIERANTAPGGGGAVLSGGVVLFRDGFGLRTGF